MINKSIISDSLEQLTCTTLMKIVDICVMSNSKIILKRNTTQADGRSLLELLFLSNEKSSNIEITVDGLDENATIDSLCKLFNDVVERTTPKTESVAQCV